MNIEHFSELKPQIKQLHNETNPQQNNQPRHEIKSQFIEEYKKLTKAAPIDWEALQRTLYRNGITFNPNSPFEAFSYEVEKMMTSINFFKIHAKISRFSLTINVLVHNAANVLQNQQSTLGTFGSIYFAKVRNKPVCIKAFRYDTFQMFHTWLPRIIKEWTILKICSAIGCAPPSRNYFGFDIIIMADCVMYGMEKGEAISEMTQEAADILKQQLWLMHQLKIIHCDIKPENIVFSPDLNRPVFIDFGLSEIIQEPCGFKTDFTFRGTPTACSREMLDLIGGGHGYIDLYYNDAFALNFSINQGITQINLEELNYNQEDDYFSRTHMLYYFAFQFYYLERNQTQATDELISFIKSGGNIKKILTFTQKVIEYGFIPSLFQDKLKPYFRETDFKDIQRKIQHLSERAVCNLESILPKSMETDDAEVEFEQNKDIRPVSYLSTEKQNILSFQQTHSYAKFISEAKQLNNQNITFVLGIAFQCIRFDVKNLAFQEKIKIAKKMNTLFAVFKGKPTHVSDALAGANIEEGLKEVKMLIMSILQECLCCSPTKWIRSNIFNVIHQAILTNIDFSAIIKNIFSYFESHYQTLLDKALVILQCNRFRDFYKFILTDNYEATEIIQYELKHYFDQQYEKFMKRNCEPNDLEIINIKRIMSVLSINKYVSDSKGFFEDYRKEVQSIKHIKIRKYLLCAMMHFKCNHLFNFSQSESMKLTKSIKESMNLFSLDFFSSIKITLKMIETTCSFSDIQAYCTYISRIINCQAVFKKINLHRWKGENLSVCTVFTQNLSQFVEIFPHICSLNPKNILKIHTVVVESIRNKTAWIEPLHSKLIQLYKAYAQFCPSIILGQGILIEQYYCFYTRFQIESSFYELYSQAQTDFLSRISMIQTQLKRVMTETPNQGKKIIFLSFKKNLYTQQLYIFKRKYCDALKCIQKLIDVCHTFNIHSLTLQFLKLQNIISHYMKEENLIIQSSIKLLKYCQQINYHSYYLIPVNEKFSFNLFVVLARHNPPMLYQLLKKLIDILQLHPIKSYFTTLFSTLDCFLKNDPTHGHVLHFNNLTSLFPSNPYLLVFHAYSLQNQSLQTQLRMFKVIAVRIDGLISFVRKNILAKYFAVFLQLISQETHRKRMGVLRRAKNFLSSQKTRVQAKKLFVVRGTVNGTKQIHHFKSKMKRYLKIIQ